MEAAFQIIVMVLLLGGLVAVVVYARRHAPGPTSRSSDRAVEDARGEARAWGRHSGFDNPGS